MVKADGAKRYHHGELREALVAAGRKLLEEKGSRDFTLRECARRAEVSHAAPAHHFASLAALLAEIATRGFRELAAAMTAEGERADANDPVSKLVAQGVGYMAFAAAHPMLFQLMFDRDANRVETPELAAAAKAAHALHVAAIEATIPAASAQIKGRMVDFSWSSMHGFIALVLGGQIGGEEETSGALKTRGLAILAAMAETVVRAGSA